MEISPSPGVFFHEFGASPASRVRRWTATIGAEPQDVLIAANKTRRQRLHGDVTWFFFLRDSKGDATKPKKTRRNGDISLFP